MGLSVNRNKYIFSVNGVQSVETQKQFLLLGRDGGLAVQSIHSWPGGRGLGGFQCQLQSIHRLVTLLCSRWASRAERLCSVAVCLVGGVWVGLSDNRNEYIFL